LTLKNVAANRIEKVATDLLQNQPIDVNKTSTVVRFNGMSFSAKELLTKYRFHNLVAKKS